MRGKLSPNNWGPSLTTAATGLFANLTNVDFINITAAQESDRIRIRDKLKLKIEKRRKTAKNGELGKYFVLCTNSAVYSKIYYKKSPDLIIPLYKNEVVCVILQLNPAATIWQFVEEFMTGL